ncbi:MAG: DUF308 domain-containing protein [Faecalibacterium sp.]|nr:DUF308 domain-containing protein [Faecalibacterium sp.]
MKKIKWHTLMLSVVYIALGVFLIAAPDVTLNAVCYTIGGAVLVCGAVQLVRYFTQREALFFAPLTLIFGIICVGVGGFLLLRSDIIISLLPTVFGLFVVFDSVTRIQNALELRRCQYKNWKSFLLLGLLSIALGILMIANPFGTMQTLVVAIGVILTLEGALNLISSLYTGLAVRTYLKLHPELNQTLEQATGTDLDGDGVVAATVEGTAREVAPDPEAETPPPALPAP